MPHTSKFVVVMRMLTVKYMARSAFLLKKKRKEKKIEKHLRRDNPFNFLLPYFYVTAFSYSFEANKKTPKHIHALQL